MWTPNIVIYHAPCDDGFGAALAAYLKFWVPGPTESLHLVPAKYGDAPPDVTGADVLIADFSFPEPVLRAMAGIARSVVVVDHHKTAQEALSKYAVADMELVNVTNIDLEIMSTADTEEPLPLVALFDMNRSGATMTWDFLFPGVPRPHMFNLLEDRDLWRFNLVDTKAFTMYLRSIPFDLKQWHDMMIAMDDPGKRQDILKRGYAILTYHDQKVEEVVGQSFIGNIGGQLVPVANSNWCFSSDVGHRLLQTHPNAPFAASYFDRADGKRQFSLRSDDTRMDCSEIAKIYGGGGHRNAAGFEALAGFYLSPPEVMRPDPANCEHDWRYTGTDYHGSHKGEDAHECTKCHKKEYR